MMLLVTLLISVVLGRLPKGLKVEIAPPGTKENTEVYDGVDYLNPEFDNG